MTWLEVKECVEQAGIKDTDKIRIIHISERHINELIIDRIINDDGSEIIEIY